MSCILSPVAPWPNQAAVCPPSNTHTLRCEPRGPQTGKPLPLLCLGFPLPRSTCLLPASFLQSTPLPLCPLVTTRAPCYPVEGGVVRVPAALCPGISLTPQQEIQALLMSPGTQFSLPTHHPPKPPRRKGRAWKGRQAEGRASNTLP